MVSGGDSECKLISNNVCLCMNLFKKKNATSSMKQAQAEKDSSVCKKMGSNPSCKKENSSKEGDHLFLESGMAKMLHMLMRQLKNRRNLASYYHFKAANRIPMRTMLAIVYNHNKTTLLFP